MNVASIVPPDGGNTPLAVAIRALGGIVAPTIRALAAAGWPHISPQAVHQARIEHRLPVRERKLGSRYYVTAGDFAEAFLGAAPATPDAPSTFDAVPRRGPGRPRLA